jgi:hypothetical protein
MLTQWYGSFGNSNGPQYTKPGGGIAKSIARF